MVNFKLWLVNEFDKLKNLLQIGQWNIKQFLCKRNRNLCLAKHEAAWPHGSFVQVTASTHELDSCFTDLQCAVFSYFFPNYFKGFMLSVLFKDINLYQMNSLKISLTNHITIT
jgi:hypothetical protein